MTTQPIETAHPAVSTGIVSPLLIIDDAAIKKGGDRAGKYLESIGKTDLRTMTKDEWRYFCRTMIAGTIEGGLDYFMTRLEREEIPVLTPATTESLTPIEDRKMEQGDE